MTGCRNSCTVSHGALDLLGPHLKGEFNFSVDDGSFGTDFYFFVSLISGHICQDIDNRLLKIITGALYILKIYLNRRSF